MSAKKPKLDERILTNHQLHLASVTSQFDESSPDR